MFNRLSMLKLCFCWCLFAVSFGTAAAYEPRIVIRDGVLFDQRKQLPFELRGFNYVRLGPGHSTFAPHSYDPLQIEAMFRKIAADGFNTVRVFINADVNNEGSIVDRSAEDGLSDAYLRNWIDFLEKAQRHNLFVIPSMAFFPQTGHYFESTPRPELIEGMNNHILSPSFIEAKRRYLKRFFAVSKERAPQAMQTLLAVDLQNESCFYGYQPFSLDEGIFKAVHGKTYDLSTQKQALMDDAAVFWIDTMADAIHAVLPGVPINVNVFTFHAVGKTGPYDFEIHPEAAWKNRFPFRPLNIALNSKADMIDIHVYNKDEAGMEAEFKSIEMAELKQAAQKTGKALVVGEFGLPKIEFPQVESTLHALEIMLSAFRKNGFQGWLYWTYDTHEQERFWNAAESDWFIYDWLKKTDRD